MQLQDLIEQAKTERPTAQKRLFDLLQGRMLMLCRRYVKHPQDAEELMVEGLCKMFKNLSSFKYNGDKEFYSWTKKIMINECLMFLRKTNLMVISSEAMPDDVQLAEEAIDKLSAAEIFQLITQLPPGYRIIFNLYEIDGIKHKEIAEMLGISEGTSKSQLSKAKKLLQTMLMQNDNEYVARKTP